MIVIEHDEFVETINEWSRLYSKRLLQSFTTVSTFVDSEFAKSAIQTLDTFSPVIRELCINDMNALATDLSLAKNLQDDYNSFGDYCYEMLKQAFEATNETLVLNSKLHYELESLHNFEFSDMTVATNFIAYNYFSGISTLLLTDFKQVTGVGLTFNMNLLAKSISTNLQQEFMQSKLAYYSEIGDVIASIRKQDVIFNKITEWSSSVNDRLVTAKVKAELAWICSYKANYKYWTELALSKQAKNTLCTLSIKSNRLIETVHQKSKTKTIQFGTDQAKVVQLDYINNLNFRFE